MTRDGDLLPTTDITKTEPGQLWPIGEVCLIIALHHLDKSGRRAPRRGARIDGRRRGETSCGHSMIGSETCVWPAARGFS